MIQTIFPSSRNRGKKIKSAEESDQKTVESEISSMDLVEIVSFVDLRYTVSKEEIDTILDVVQFVKYVDEMYK